MCVRKPLLVLLNFSARKQGMKLRYKHHPKMLEKFRLKIQKCLEMP